MKSGPPCSAAMALRAHAARPAVTAQTGRAWGARATGAVGVGTMVISAAYLLHSMSRLQGIDAPERYTPFASQVHRFL